MTTRTTYYPIDDRNYPTVQTEPDDGWRGYEAEPKSEGVIPMTTPAPAPTMREAITDLLTYRKQAGALNFQLEKADEYMRRLEAALAADPTPDLIAALETAEATMEIADEYLTDEAANAASWWDARLKIRTALAKARGEA